MKILEPAFCMGVQLKTNSYGIFIFILFIFPYHLILGVGGFIHVLGVGSLVFDFVISKSWRILPKKT